MGKQEHVKRKELSSSLVMPSPGGTAWEGPLYL